MNVQTMAFLIISCTFSAHFNLVRMSVLCYFIFTFIGSFIKDVFSVLCCCILFPTYVSSSVQLLVVQNQLVFEKTLFVQCTCIFISNKSLMVGWSQNLTKSQLSSLDTIFDSIVLTNWLEMHICRSKGCCHFIIIQISTQCIHHLRMHILHFFSYNRTTVEIQQLTLITAIDNCCSENACLSLFLQSNVLCMYLCVYTVLYRGAMASHRLTAALLLIS